MSPLFFALLVSFGVASVLVVLLVWQMDVNEHLRHAGKSLPTITHLPRAVAIPTVWRKEKW